MRNNNNNNNLDMNETTTTPQLQMKQILKTLRIQQQEKELKEKATHGQFLRTLEQQHIDKEASNLWLKSSSLKRATESTICAIQ